MSSTLEDLINQDLSAELMSKKAKHAASPTSAASSTTSGTSPPRESHVAEWKPSLNRRQSWSRQEKKHEVQMTRMGEDVVKEEPGFSERHD